MHSTFSRARHSSRIFAPDKSVDIEFVFVLELVFTVVPVRESHTAFPENEKGHPLAWLPARWPRFCFVRRRLGGPDYDHREKRYDDPGKVHITKRMTPSPGREFGTCRSRNRIE